MKQDSDLIKFAKFAYQAVISIGSSDRSFEPLSLHLILVGAHILKVVFNTEAVASIVTEPTGDGPNFLQVHGLQHAQCRWQH